MLQVCYCEFAFDECTLSMDTFSLYHSKDLIGSGKFLVFVVFAPKLTVGLLVVKNVLAKREKFAISDL